MLFGLVHRAAEDAVGGPVGAFPLGHAAEDFGRRGRRCGVAVGVFGVGFADDVRVVRVSAAAEGGVELAGYMAGVTTTWVSSTVEPCAAAMVVAYAKRTWCAT